MKWQGELTQCHGYYKSHHLEMLDEFGLSCGPISREALVKMLFKYTIFRLVIETYSQLHVHVTSVRTA